MKPVDLDGLFDEKLAQYMEENKGKYTEKQWENIIPKLYKKFGDTYVAKIKATPKEYYAKMTDGELTETFAAHLAQKVPVPDFLCSEIEERNCIDALLPLLREGDGETVSYALNLIGADARAFPDYFSIITEEKFDEDIRDAAVEKLTPRSQLRSLIIKRAGRRSICWKFSPAPKRAARRSFISCSTSFSQTAAGCPCTLPISPLTATSARFRIFLKR